jgi:hypothetical protein
MQYMIFSVFYLVPLFSSRFASHCGHTMNGSPHVGPKNAQKMAVIPTWPDGVRCTSGSYANARLACRSDAHALGA